MNTNIRQAVLKILLLKEEHSQKDLTEAVKFISDNSKSDILDLLVDKKNITSKNKDPKKSIENQISKAVIDLKDRDNKKYNLLMHFDTLIRKGDLLPRLDSIKNFGAKYSKNFEAGKSRKEAIPKLMDLLSKIESDELSIAIKEIIDGSGRDSSEYAELANYLIHGNI